MGWRVISITAPIVIIESGVPNTGLFEYSGTPALGNPPQFAVVAPGVTTDPFGNPVTSSKILVQGNVITESAGIFRTSAAAPLVQLDGPHDAVLIYDASANLIVTATPAAGNDGLGHNFVAGVASYSGGVISRLFGAAVQIGTPAQVAGTGGASPAALVAGGPASVQLSSGLSASTDTQAAFRLFSAASNPDGANPVMALQAALSLFNTATPAAASGAAVLFADSAGFLHSRPDSATGDTTIYNEGHFVSFSTTDEPISSTTFSTVCGGGATVAAGKYRVHAELTCVQGPNIASNHYRLGFTGTISQVRMKMVDTQDNVSSFVATTTSNNGLLAAHAFGAATTYVATLHGIIVTTSTGTLSIQAAMDAAGNTFTVLALSDFHLEPLS